MELHRLHKDELIHEVGIRGNVYADIKKVTVEDLRNTLRELKEKESAGEELEDMLEIDLDKELKVIEVKLSEVSLGIVALQDPEDKETAPARIRTVLSHSNRRLVRLLSYCQIEGVEDDEVKKVKDLGEVIKSYITQFRALNPLPIYQATSFGVPSVRPESRNDSDSESGDERDNGKGKGKDKGRDKDKNKGRNSKFSKQPSVSFHKWGLQFSGEGRPSVNSFLTDVEDKASTYNISFNTLLQGVVEFLEGTARTWYRINKGEIGSWEEFKILLRREFLPLDYYDNLAEEIRNRRQGSDELIGPFVSNMLGLYSRLEDVVPEEEVLKQIVKNLHPYYTERLALTEVLSIRTLKDLGKKLEVSRHRVESYENPSRAKPKPLEPEFACKSTQRNKAVVNEVRAENPSAPTAGRKFSFKCHNCASPDHKFMDCPKPRTRKFCHACGRKDVTVVTCPNKCKEKRLQKLKSQEKGEGGEDHEGGK